MDSFKVAASVVASFIRRMVRPAVTVIFVLLAAYFGIGLWKMLEATVVAGQLTGEQIMVLAQSVLQFLFTVIAAVVSYWFASRGNSSGSTPPDGGG